MFMKVLILVMLKEYVNAMSIQLQEEGYIVKTEAPVSITFITKKKKEMDKSNEKTNI